MAYFLLNDQGPFDIAFRIRKLAGAEKEGRLEGFFPVLFSCIYCMSTWTTISAYLLWLLEPVIIMIIAAMAVALIVHYLAKDR